MSPKTALHLLHRAQDQRICPKQGYNTCWPTRAPTCNRLRRKLGWFGPVTRLDSLCKTVLRCMIEGGRRRGSQKKR
ncbi:hypothetical protein DPMN_123069 [Dreissena polymorpha]|uniref:Uncharacterized protein n=1 Tax=Dreissena polymorpha TaxID=45954 RepID=A0A9D4GTR8_DREPO|nr:hypothetical protein DPMN_123069 [Dreissena polymorpha]